MRNYAVKPPLNEGRVWLSDGVYGSCLVAGEYKGRPVSYDGAQLDIQFPEYHVKAGTPGAHGGYHQGPLFAPDKVRVMPFRVGKTIQNVIRFQGNFDGRGVGVCTRQFDAPILWQPDIEYVWMTRCLFPSDSKHPIYFNTETRGLPLFAAKKNEASEVIGVHFTDRQIMCKWWHDGYDGIGTDEQRYEKLPYAVKRDTWYRVTVTLQAGNANEWLAHIVVKEGGKVVWDLQTDASNCPNRFTALGMAMFGIERGGSAADPLETGTVYVAASCPWLITPQAIAIRRAR